VQVSICDPQISAVCFKIPSVPAMLTITHSLYKPTHLMSILQPKCSTRVYGYAARSWFVIYNTEFHFLITLYSVPPLLPLPIPDLKLSNSPPARGPACLCHDLKVVSSQLPHLFSVRPTAEPAAWCHGARSPLDVTIRRWHHYQCDMN